MHDGIKQKLVEIYRYGTRMTRKRQMNLHKTSRFIQPEIRDVTSQVFINSLYCQNAYEKITFFFPKTTSDQT